EGAGDEPGAELERHLARGDALEGMGTAFFGRGGFVVGGRKLPLRQAVTTIVHDDVGHVHATADGVAELTKSNGGGVAIARHANVDEVAVSEVGPGGNRGHTAVDRVEAVAAGKEI